MAKILVVDDEKSIRVTLRKFLTDAGYEVTVAEDVDEALKVLADNDVDVVVTDIIMPRATGVDLLKSIKNMSSRSQVIMMTGEPTVETASQAVRMDAFDYLPKPVGKDRLLNIVGKAVRIKSLDDERLRLTQENKKYQENLEVMIAERTNAWRESKARAAAIIDHAVDGIATINERGAIESVNPATLRLFGYLESELIGQNIRMLMPDPYHAEHDGYIENYMQTGIAKVIGLNQKVLGLRKDGSTFPLMVGISEVLFGDKRLFSGVMRDLTVEKKLESQLRQAQKMEAIGTLAGGIAHDFNNILAAQMGYTHLASKSVSPESETARYLDQVQKASDRAKDLVAQILSFSSQGDTTFHTLSMLIVVQEAFNLLKSTIPANISFKQDVASDCPSIVGDDTQIHQIVMNLTTNAYHAVRDGGGTISVSLNETELDSVSAEQHPDLHEGRYVLLSIADTGHGMDEATVARIFEPYYTTKEFNEGTGLGLSTVLGIVGEHSGAITVNSELGQGTTFNVYLPVATGTDDHSDESPTSVTTAPPHITGKRIIFVDDEAALVDLYTTELRGLEYEVTPCTDSVEALEIFRAHPENFDMVITDQAMPKMTGMELARNLFEIRPDILILMCTGFSEAVNREKALAAGLCDYIRKPVLPKEMGRRIYQVFAKTANNQEEE